MNLSAQLYQPRPGKNAALTITWAPAIRQNFTQFAALLLQYFGIEELKVTPKKSGIITVDNVEMVPMVGVDLPVDLVTGRNYMARRMADLMLLFGITGIKLELEEGEIKELVTRWEEATAAVEQLESAEGIERVISQGVADVVGQQVSGEEDQAGAGDASDVAKERV